MKVTFSTFLLALFLGFVSQAQINVGPIIQVRGTGTDEFRPGVLNQLKTTSTYFVYGKADEKNLDEWQNTLKAVWKVTPIKFISFEDFMKLKGHSRKSFLVKQSFSKIIDRVSQNSRTVSSYYYTYLSLITIDKNKRIHRHCRIEMYPTKKTRGSGLKVKDNFTSVMNFLYNDAEFHNWHPGLLKAPISQVSAYLQLGTSLNFYHEIDTKAELGKLRTQTLYIPDYAFIYGGVFFKKDFVDIEATLKKYGYKAEVVEAKKLSDMILNSAEDIYVMLYMKSMNDKFITVWNCKTNQLLYKEYKPNKYHIKKKDFKDLTRAIYSTPKLLY